MRNIELLRPIEYKQLCDWAFSRYSLFKDLLPDHTESEIAKIIFDAEYKNVMTSTTLRNLASKNLTSIESIPDLVLAILNMEAPDGRSNKLDDLFVSSMIYSLQVHLKSQKGDSDLKKIGIAFYLIQDEIKKRSLDSEKFDEAFEILSVAIIGYGLYKTYMSTKDTILAINKILDAI